MAAERKGALKDLGLLRKQARCVVRFLPFKNLVFEKLLQSVEKVFRLAKNAQIQGASVFAEAAARKQAKA